MFKKALLVFLSLFLMAGVALATEYDFQIYDINPRIPDSTDFRISFGSLNNNDLIIGFYRLRGGTPSDWKSWWYNYKTDQLGTYDLGEAGLGFNNLNEIIGSTKDYNIDTTYVTTLPNIHPIDRNDNGEYLGTTVPNSWIWKDGIFIRYIHHPLSISTAAYDMNNHKQVVGNYTPSPSGYNTGYIYDYDTDSFESIPFPGNDVWLHAINNNGIAAGWLRTLRVGIVHKDGITETVDIPGFDSTRIYGINDANIIAGVATADGKWFVFTGTPIHRYNITVSSPGIGNGGYTDFDGTHTVIGGTEITITAHPDAEYEFGGWVGVPAGQENDNPITLTVDSNLTIIAMFGVVPVDITVEIEPFLFYMNTSKSDLINIKSKFSADVPFIDGEVITTDITIILRDKGINGGDLILNSTIEPVVKDNGKLLKN